jgi:uncharacterized protein
MVRKPGTQHESSVSISVPAVLGTEMIAVPQGATASLSVRLDVVTDGIWASGSFQATAVGVCSRCLEEARYDVDAAFEGLFLYPGAEVEEDSDSDDLYTFDGETIDLEPAVLDAVVTQLPFRPLCEPDCLGLCDQCGARLADNPGHAHEVLDPRWAALELVKDRIPQSDEKES